MRNWGRWSEIDRVILPDIILGDTAFENILSISVLELLLTVVSWGIWDKSKWEDKESKN